jgi:hypothetical protein
MRAGFVLTIALFAAMAGVAASGTDQRAIVDGIFNVLWPLVLVSILIAELGRALMPLGAFVAIVVVLCWAARW